jgi:hypothetical protein
MFAISDRFTVSRVAATATVIAAVMALGFGLRAAGLSTYGITRAWNHIATEEFAIAIDPPRIDDPPSASASTRRESMARRCSCRSRSYPVQDDGRFHPSWRPFIVACLMGRVSMQDVERERDAFPSPYGSS